MKSFIPLAVFSGFLATSFAQNSTNATAAELTDAAPDSVGDLNVTQAVVSALNSGIDLTALNISLAAMSFMSDLADNTTSTGSTNQTQRRWANKGYVDTHAHVVPPWYNLLVPTTGGEPTPEWSLPGHLAFMDEQGIGHSILSMSAPGANVFPGQQVLTTALARLLNVNMAAIAAYSPQQFSWHAVVPLPDCDDAIAEVKYAVDFLGASGIILYSNYEGLYLGDPTFIPFWQYIQSRSSPVKVFIHPTEPVLRQSNGQLIDCNPTQYRSGIDEYYFETARTWIDLSWTLSVVNYTNVNWILSNLGGAFTGEWDRMIKSIPQDIPIIEPVYHTRVWWDTAGPTFPNQVKGLEGYGEPITQVVYGTEYPYAPNPASYTTDQQAITGDSALTASTISSIMSGAASALFGF